MKNEKWRFHKIKKMTKIDQKNYGNHKNLAEIMVLTFFFRIFAE